MSLLKKIFKLKTLLIIGTVISMISILLSYLSPFVHPDTIAVLQFFGLTYWIIFLFNIAFMLIWTFMRSRWALVVLLTILLGGNLHFRVFAFGGDDENTSSTELSVMSYNVRLFDLYNANRTKSYETKDKIFDYIIERDPDVVCFQEFFHQDPPTRFVTKDSILKCMKFTDHHERFAQKMLGRQNFGIALFSKYPIIEKGFVNFPDQNNSFNYCIYADIVKDDTIRVYNLHLQSIHLQQDDYALFSEENEDAAEQSSNFFRLFGKVKNAYPVRAGQAERIAQHIKNSPYPVVLCGDFNDTPLSYAYNQVNGELIDAFRNTSYGMGKTYTGKIPAGRIDYIFHSPELGSKEFHIQKEILSDHYAIDCKVFVKK